MGWGAPRNVANAFELTETTEPTQPCVFRGRVDEGLQWGVGGGAPLDVVLNAHLFELLPEHTQNLHQLFGVQQGFLHNSGRVRKKSY